MRFYQINCNLLGFNIYALEENGKKIVKNVTAVTGISNEAIKWARQKNNQSIQPKTKHFP